MKPSNFCTRPYGSILQKTEAEIIALNIMVILKRTGNTFRRLTWGEYKKERMKDGNFTMDEREYFEEVIDYCKSSETAKLFCPDWKKIK